MAVKERGSGTTGGSSRRGHGRTRPASGVALEQPYLARWLLTDTGSTWIWALVRVYVGGTWLAAGMRGLNGAVGTAGAPPAGWMLLTGGHAAFAWIEVALGSTVLLGVLTGISAFLGTILGFDLLLTGGPATGGAIGPHPLLTALGVALILGWRVAGWWGLDRWLLPAAGCRRREAADR